MEFPKRIKVVDQIYDIIYIDTPKEVDVKGEEELLGQVVPDTHTIRIFKPIKYSEEDVWNAIWHEVFHVIIDVFKIKEIENLSKEKEEHVIHLLATGINVIMIDNGFRS